ncbi:MAG TPA: MCP four helix bundle domain-containing protein [Saprospiraceae bacterium]|nr:MCP four helix bundle domain-containing protein [Saprospiraceae bacterium]HPN69903.1 MCP four helix bundle domain-containing protein [Saprospiraceae bacterium]
MKWTYSIQNKLTAAAVLFVLCVVILYANYNDRMHTSKVIGLISTLYQDRIIAEAYIYNMSNDLYEIKEALIDPVGETPNVKIQDMISKINVNMAAYEKTKLTEKESLIYDQLRLEIPQNWEAKNNQNNALEKMADNSLLLLGALSEIQLNESKSIVADSEKTYKMSKLSSEFAFAIVIIILIILQALVFASKTLHISNEPVDPSLN